MLIKVARKGETTLSADYKVKAEEAKRTAKEKTEALLDKAKSFGKKGIEYAGKNKTKLGLAAASLVAAGVTAKHFVGKKKDK